jgi:uncharacterized damage-inducible protein DinB
MISTAYCQTMARYNSWMNRKLYALCAGLSDEVRKRDLHAFFRSIHGTLDHIFACDRMFMSHFTRGTARHMTEGTAYADFAALRVARERLDTEILDLSGGLSDDWLAAPAPFTHDEDGLPRHVTRAFWAMHMFNHQTHHRGQVTTLLTQLGQDIGSTDLHMSLPPIGGATAG